MLDLHRSHHPAPEPPDQIALWIHAMGRREEDALGRLHARCIGRVFACAKAIVVQAELADEVASASFMQAWRDALQFDAARGSAMGWLLMIARSRSLDALRQRTVRERRESFVEGGELEALPGDGQADPRVACEQARRDRGLQKLLESLLPMQRQLIQLAFTQGLTHQEVATHTRLPLGTVKSHINRGLRTLRDRCEAAGISP